MAKYKTTREIIELIPEFAEAAELLSDLEQNAQSLSDPIANILVKKLKDNLKVGSKDDKVYRKWEKQAEKELAAKAAEDKKEDKPITPKVIRKRTVVFNLKKAEIPSKVAGPAAASAPSKPTPEPPSVIYCEATSDAPKYSMPSEKDIKSVKQQASPTYQGSYDPEDWGEEVSHA